MASTIAAVTTSGGGVVTTADASGNLNLLAGTTTVVALTAAGAAVSGTLSNTTGATFATSSGNVGIGTSSPGAKLDVAATTAIVQIDSSAGTAGAAVTRYKASNRNWVTGVNATDASGAYSFYDNTASAERMRIDSSGNVGIGTSSPGYRLEVSGHSLIKTTNPMLLFTDTTSSGSTWRIQGNVAALGDIGFYDQTNSRTALVIGSNGRVLVNSTSDVGGNNPVFSVNAEAAAVFGNIMEARWTGTGSIYHLLVRNGNGLVGGVTSSGSTTAFVTSSDYRLKNTIAPMTGALNKVALLKPCTYKWKVDGSDGQGFIAHELQEVVPGCVTGEKDATREEEYEVTPAVPAVVDADGVETTPAVEAVKGIRTVPSYQGVDTSFLVATLTAAIQELKAIIDTQAARITALEAKA